MDALVGFRGGTTDKVVIVNAQLPPKGLRNLGNSCYINAVLQGLSHCDLIHASVRESLHYSSCPLRQDCVRCSLERCVSDLRRPVAALAINNPIARIVRVLPHISMNGSLMTSGRQEDAHEFLSNLLVSAQECPSAGSSPESYKLPAPRCALSLRSLFQGKLSSSVFCLACKSLSTTREAVQGLELEVGRAAALNTALDEYCCTETLSAAAGNAYDCCNCKTHTTAQKALRLVSVPPVLRIQLKRFRYGSGCCEKLTHHVEYPEVLDMSPYVLPQEDDCGAEQGEENEQPRANALTRTPEALKNCREDTSYHHVSTDSAHLLYRLSAVIVHVGGSPESGHYTALVRCGSWWYLTNDDTVTRVALQDALSQQAYVLLYERVSLLDRHSQVGLSKLDDALSPLLHTSSRWASPFPAALASIGRSAASSIVREPGRLVSHSSAYNTTSGAPVASTAVLSTPGELGSAGGYFSSNSRAGTNPLFSSAKLAARDAIAVDSAMSTRDFNGNRDSKSYLVEVQQKAAASSAPASFVSAQENKKIHNRTSDQRPATEVPSSRVYSGFSRRRLFSSLNIFTFSSSKSKREIHVRKLNVLGQHQRPSREGDQLAGGNTGYLTPGTRRARVDGFFLPAEQHWGKSPVPATTEKETETATETGLDAETDDAPSQEARKAQQDEENEMGGVDNSPKRRRLNVNNAGSGDGNVHYVRTTEVPQVTAGDTRDRQRKKASSWVSFIPEKIRALFSAK